MECLLWHFLFVHEVEKNEKKNRWWKYSVPFSMIGNWFEFVLNVGRWHNVKHGTDSFLQFCLNFIFFFSYFGMLIYNERISSNRNTFLFFLVLISRIIFAFFLRSKQTHKRRLCFLYADLPITIPYEFDELFISILFCWMV